MSSKSLTYRIRINARDPAREQIALDLIECGGLPIAETSLTYGFPSASSRDEALRVIRGSFGTISVDPIDPVAPPPRGSARQPQDQPKRPVPAAVVLHGLPIRGVG